LKKKLEMPLWWWKPVLAVVASIGTLHAVLQHHYQDQIDVWFMKFFRDLGRYKALQRRRQHLDSTTSSKGLLAFLADKDADPLLDLLAVDAEQEEELHLPTLSKQELWTLGNHESDDGSLLLGILGRVYDVTEGDKFYGPTGNYGHFAGRDVTYALATGCKRMECVETDWTKLSSSETENKDSSAKSKATTAVGKVFSDDELLEAKKWLSFFHLHDKYPLVGKLEGDSFEDLVQQLLKEDEEKEAHHKENNQSEDTIPDASLTEETMLTGMEK
jgi:membrane-associated progesterone receptor component